MLCPAIQDVDIGFANTNYEVPSTLLLHPFWSWPFLQPENEVCCGRRATQKPEPRGALGTVSVAVHADLHHSLDNRKAISGNIRCFQFSGQIAFLDLR